MKPIKIFISYSKHDREAFLVPMLRYLKPLARGGVIETWDDSKILAGEEWDGKIKAEIETADVILLLVSDKSLDTDYIWNVEIEAAMRRHEQGTARVIPIILSKCLWEAKNSEDNYIFPPAKLNALPAKGKPVKTWEEQNDAWDAVAKVLKDIQNQVNSAVLINVEPKHEAEKIKKQILPVKPDSEFIKIIKRNIATALDSASVIIFKDQIHQEIAEVLNEKPGDLSQIPTDLADKLFLLACQNAERNIAIETVLYNATMACLYKEGEKYNESKSHHSDIREASEKILSWLVLAAIREDSLSEILQTVLNTSKLYFELPVKTTGGIELFLSRGFQRKSDLLSDEANLSGRYAKSFPPSLLTWSTETNVQNMIRMIWNSVFPSDPRETHLAKEDITKLNSELRVLKNKKFLAEHHYLTIKGLDGDSYEHFQRIYPRLLEELSELTLVHFGFDGGNLFVVPEDDLINAIRNFLVDINKALA